MDEVSFKLQRKEAEGRWRRFLHNEEFHNMYGSLIIITMTKPRRIRWAGLVAFMGRLEMYTKF
jgi:hypothetical protein